MKKKKYACNGPKKCLVLYENTKKKEIHMKVYDTGYCLPLYVYTGLITYNFLLFGQSLDIYTNTSIF